MNQSQTAAFAACKFDTPSIRIAWLQASWHESIIDVARQSFVESVATAGIKEDQVDKYKVPGSFELPLLAKTLAKSDKYDIIVGAGLVVDGGIYRHDFVAASVVQGFMQVQLETGVPILSVVLTPHQFHSHETHEAFFAQHFRVKGAEAAEACIGALNVYAKLKSDSCRKVA
jgi:6,7-dimethyl-8-ribityllumazine synthase